MSGPKKAARKKSSAKRSPAQKRTARSVPLEKRAARDPYLGPSSKRIEQSFDKGTTVSLDSFRSIIDWS
jgi:hypothetical protein